MAGTTTTAINDPVMREWISDAYEDEFNTETQLPFMKHADKLDIGHNQGNSVQLPNLIHNAGVLTSVAEGANNAIETYKTSAVLIDMSKYGTSATPTVEAIKQTSGDFMRQLIKAQMRQAHRGINLLIAQNVGYGGLLIRADRDTSYQQWVDASAIGEASNIFTSTSLVDADDRFNGGRCSPISGGGQGWTRAISDYTGTTGIVATATITGVQDPYDVAISDSSLYTQEAAAAKTTHALVSAANGISSSDILSTSLMSYAQFIHAEKLHTVPNSGIPWRLYLDPHGVQDLIDSDALFRAAVANYRGEFFDNPTVALGHWWNTAIFQSEKVFRSTNTGANTDAAYGETGAVHYYPFVGNNAFIIPQVTLWGGSGPGGLEFFLVNTPDSNNPDLAYVTIGYKLYMAAVIPFNSRVINLACGTAQAA